MRLPAKVSAALAGSVALAACGGAPPSGQPAPTLLLAAQTISLPDGTARFTGFAGAERLNDNCLACHSREMIAYQPRLTRARWADNVKKMRELHGAPIAPGDDAAIVDALMAMPVR